MKQPKIAAIYSRFLALSSGSLVLVGGLGYLPTTRWIGNGVLQVLAMALGVAWVASLVGSIPICLAQGKSPLEAMPYQFGAMALRLVVILSLGMSVAWSGLTDTKPFLIWLVIGHIVLLVTDTYLARSLVSDPRPRETEGALEER